jgi:ribosome-associated toxin RatA of RatAB toxin-antitoxin module
MERSRLLRRALLANAVFSIACGTALATAPARIAVALGLERPAPLVGLGPGLLLFGVSLVLLARAPVINPGRARGASAQELGGVGGSVVLLAGWPQLLGATGRLVVGGVAAVVGALALLQLSGLRSSIGSDGTRGEYGSMLEARRVLPIDPRAAWAVVSDLDRYADFAAGLRYSRVLSGHGVGLRRECGDHRGRSWTETCAVWEEGRVYAMEVDTAAAGYSFPLRALRGEWRVSPVDGGTEVAMRFDFTARGGAIGELIAAAIMAPRARRDMEAVLDRWEGSMRTGSASAAA